MTSFAKMSAALNAGWTPAPKPVAPEAPKAETFPAAAWMERVFGRYASVATEEQIAAARELSCCDSLLGVRVEHVGPSFAELDGKLAAIKAAKVQTITVPAMVGAHEVTVDGQAFVVTIAAVAPAPCCDENEVEPCKACVPSAGPVSLESYLAATANDPRLSPSIADREAESDPLASLPFPKPAREPFLRVAPAPLPRPVVPAGRYALADLVAAHADSYADPSNAVASLIADTIRELADRIRATGAKSVSEFREREDVLDQSRADELQSAYYDRGFVDGVESVTPAYA